MLLQLARHRGVRIIGTASPRHHDALRASGVFPVDYNDPNLPAIVRGIAPRGVDAIFDNIGGLNTRAAWSLLARHGTLVSYTTTIPVSGSNGLGSPLLKTLGQTLLWSALPQGKRATFYDFWADRGAHTQRFRTHVTEDLAQVFALLEARTITATIAAQFPLTEAIAALELAESRALTGKVILLP